MDKEKVLTLYLHLKIALGEAEQAVFELKEALKELVEDVKNV